MEHHEALCYGRVVDSSEQAYRSFQRRVDRLCFLITAADFPEEDVNMERQFLRAKAACLFPDKLALYDMIYENRFRRIWEQFRQPTMAQQ